MKSIKKTQEQVKDELQAAWPDIEILSTYTGANDPLNFRCKKCGHEWSTTLRGAIHNKYGCPHCGVSEALRKAHTQEYQKRIEKQGLNTFVDVKYTFTETGQSRAYITVKCNECGELRTACASNILRYPRCKKCGWKIGGRKQAHDTDWFINKSKEIHGNKYIYDKSVYNTIGTKVCITCPEHGDFYQDPRHHIFRGMGCPRCSMSSYEQIAYTTLKEQGIDFKQEWGVVYKNKQMWVDFMFTINDTTYIVECNGIQHYKEIVHYRRSLKEQQQRDNLLEEYCKENNIKLIWIKYDEPVRDRILEILNTNVPSC